MSGWEPVRTYRRQGYCESCGGAHEHLYFEEKFPPGGVELRIKRVCQSCYAKGYKSYYNSGRVEEAGVWRED